VPFKKLIIPKKDEIVRAVSEMPDVKACSDLRQIGNQHRLEVTPVEGNISYVDFYFNKGGDVTIQPKVGPNPEFSAKVAQHVKDTLCCSAEALKKTASLPNFKEEDCATLIQFLREELGLTVAMSTHPLHLSYTLSSDRDGKVTLNYYSSTKKLVVQGAACSLKFQVNNAIAEICPEVSDALILWMTDAYDVKMTKEDVERELSSLLPISFSHIQGKLIEILKPGIVYLRMSLPKGVNDYSSFVYPGFRALEGALKIVFQKQNPATEFRCEPLSGRFDERGGRYILNGQYGPAFSDVTLVSAINEAYTFFKNNRHSVFHVDDSIETSRLIETKEKADELFRYSLIHIEKIISEAVKRFG